MRRSLRDITLIAENARMKAQNEGKNAIEMVAQVEIALSIFNQEELKALYDTAFDDLSVEFMAKRLAEEHFCRLDITLSSFGEKQ